jgi:hypothetical protein
MDMRKLAILSMAVVASLTVAGAASAIRTAAITGPNTPGTNTYTITMTWDDANISGVVVSVNTDGTYTGAFTETTPGFNTPLAGPNVLAASTGVAGSWGAVNGTGPVPGQTLTIGTVEITVGAGDVINPFFGSLDGFVTFTSFTTVGPNAPLSGVTIIPEPTTAALLGLGIVGLVVAGRRNRA